jgi:predicted RNA binding protein YcfA (HicA-like mRNA interferase family)
VGRYGCPLLLKPITIGYRCPAMKVRDVLARLTRTDGPRSRATAATTGSSVHPQKVTVDGKPNMDVPIGTLRNIFRQAGWPWQARR